MTRNDACANEELDWNDNLVAIFEANLTYKI